MEKAVRKRQNVFAAARKNHEDRLAYIFASQHASSVIAKAKAEAGQATFLPLSLSEI